MKITKSMLAAGAVTTVAFASLAGLGTVSAQSNNPNGSSIVDSIATKFGLNKDEVQAVFDEHKDQMHANHEQRHEQRLQELVDNGTISADQKAALDAKHDEMEAAREALKNQDISREEMQEQMKKAHEEFKAWAIEQGIDPEDIKPEENHRGMGHHGRMMNSHGDASEQ
jgi:polyhydroxyalkanoate synthesis regulator phasin